MFRGRGKQMAVAAAGCALIGAASLVAVPLSASAQGTSPVTVTVTAKPASTTTGHKIAIIAKVTAAVTEDATTLHALHAARASTANAGPTGTVTFSITGTPVTTNAQTVNCKVTDTIALKHGKATCKVPAAMLMAVQSPYTVSVTYSGDSTYASGVGGTTVTVGKARTHSKVTVDSRPRSGTGNTFTDVIHGGPGGSLMTGTVTFAVSDTPSQAPAKRKCAGGDVQPVAVTGNVGTATCVLVPGWFVVPSATHMTPHPHGAWNVTATYSGDGNFLSSTASKSGHSKF